MFFGKDPWVVQACVATHYWVLVTTARNAQVACQTGSLDQQNVICVLALVLTDSQSFGKGALYGKDTVRAVKQSKEIARG